MNKPQTLLNLINELWYQSPGLILPEAAGFLFKHKNEGLFLKRANEELDSPGAFAYVGGGIYNGESPYSTAIRECQEEIGTVPSFRLLGTYQHGTYVTHLAEVENKDFEIKLNHEHESAHWALFGDQSLSPLHPGVMPVLQHFGLV